MKTTHGMHLELIDPAFIRNGHLIQDSHYTPAQTLPISFKSFSCETQLTFKKSLVANKKFAFNKMMVAVI